jgi:hypothetical protein
MANPDTIIAVYEAHPGAESAIKELTAAGFTMKQLSVIGKGYHTEENVVGFYNTGDRVKFWGERGAFWGGLWGLFFGGLFLSIPIIGHVVVLGYLASMVISGVETAVLVGGMSAIGAAIYGLGIPKDSVIQYETELKADKFLLLVHGTPEEATRARAILGTTKPQHLDFYQGTKQISAPHGAVRVTA